MFHRRLSLLLGVAVLGGVALVGQLGRLTLVQGATRRAEAESKLVTREWTPPGGAGRGRILDRKGRVLAQDRPSLDVLVDYSMISGEWAIKRGGATARKRNASKWKSLGPDERSALSDEYTAVYQQHLDRMWQLVARATDRPLSEVEEAKRQIVQRVKTKAAYLYSARLGREIDNRLSRGQEISTEVEDEVQSQVERPIVEQQSPHVLLSNVSDEAAFELMRLAEEKTPLDVPGGDGAKPEMLSTLPGLAVVPSSDREYPLDTITVEMDQSTLPEPVRGQGKKAITVEGVGYHVIGRMKEKSQKEDNDRRAAHLESDGAFRDWATTPVRANKREDRGRYFDDDAAGLAGIEASQEDTLRGLRGLKTTQLDTGEVAALAPVRGRDVQLTIDAMLQARVQAAMSPALGLAVSQEWHGKENPTVPVGTALNGAAVVLEVDTGDILALVSTPSISRRELAEHPERVFEDPLNQQVDVPWIDRAIARPYPPGSIAKAVILNGAVLLGKFNLDTTIDCTGHLFPDKPNMFRCWIYKQHGGVTHTQTLEHTLSAPEALMVSCNIFFFTLGQRLGPQGITDTYQMFGVQQPWNLGVGLEYKGDIGEERSDGSHKALSIQDAIQMGIGQGPVAWTPLHAADAYCTLARGGIKMRPHVVNAPGEPETDDLHLDKRAVKEALHGLSMSANDMKLGTGAYIVFDGKRVSHWNTPNTVVWGKTGTATAPTITVFPTIKDLKTGADVANPLWERALDAGPIAEAAKEPEFKLPAGKRALRWGDHSWFVVLVGTKADNRPRFAIAVMMEYAGSGGKVSGPIVNQIIHALADEGYLS